MAFRDGADAALRRPRRRLLAQARPRRDGGGRRSRLDRARRGVEDAPQQTRGRRRHGRGRGDDEARPSDGARSDDAREPGRRTTDESDYDLIALTLDRMEAAVGAGQYQQAEQARLEAYAFFEFGPERRLKALRPGAGARRSRG